MLQLLESDQQSLLCIARDAVSTHLTKTPPIARAGHSSVLNERRAIFVSLHQRRKLRGCVGTVEPSGPLYQLAADYALAAAVQDPRFPPLTAGELPGTDFEISVLSEMEPVGDIDEIVVGVHGVVIRKGTSRGILLPQVATSFGWDRQRLLNEVCLKAGLPGNAWKDGLTIHRFSALVFGEHNFNLSLTS